MRPTEKTLSTYLPKEMQMCTPDFLEMPKEYMHGLRKKIYCASHAKRQRLWKQSQEEKNRQELKLRLKKWGMTI